MVVRLLSAAGGSPSKLKMAVELLIARSCRGSKALQNGTVGTMFVSNPRTVTCRRNVETPFSSASNTSTPGSSDELNRYNKSFLSFGKTIGFFPPGVAALLILPLKNVCGRAEETTIVISFHFIPISQARKLSCTADGIFSSTFVIRPVRLNRSELIIWCSSRKTSIGSWRKRSRSNTSEG